MPGNAEELLEARYGDLVFRADDVKGAVEPWDDVSVNECEDDVSDQDRPSLLQQTHKDVDRFDPMTQKVMKACTKGVMNDSPDSFGRHRHTLYRIPIDIVNEQTQRVLRETDGEIRLRCVHSVDRELTMSGVGNGERSRARLHVQETYDPEAQQQNAQKLVLPSYIRGRSS